MLNIKRFHAKQSLTAVYTGAALLLSPLTLPRLRPILHDRRNGLASPRALQILAPRAQTSLAMRTLHVPSTPPTALALAVASLARGGVEPRAAAGCGCGTTGDDFFSQAVGDGGVVLALECADGVWILLARGGEEVDADIVVVV